MFERQTNQRETSRCYYKSVSINKGNLEYIEDFYNNVNNRCRSFSDALNKIIFLAREYQKAIWDAKQREEQEARRRAERELEIKKSLELSGAVIKG